jgi:Flp pilus assembly protein TadG
MSRRLLRHHLHLNQRGAVVIEFAVVVLLLLLILFGILEFSFTFLQRHFIANAAREGVRIGIRAQNYNCFDAADTSFACNSAKDLGNQVYRKDTVIDQLTKCNTNPKGYLCTLYQNDMAEVFVETDELDANTKTLAVRVEAPNFFPHLLSGLVPGYPSGDNKIKYSAIGNYENADEP